jgi:hypothetical protein
MMIACGEAEPLVAQRFSFTDVELRDRVKTDVLGPDTEFHKRGLVITYYLPDEPWLDVWTRASMMDDIMRAIVLWKPQPVTPGPGGMQ